MSTLAVSLIATLKHKTHGRVRIALADICACVEWAWSLYISMFMVYLPRKYNYLRGAFDKAISLLERLDAAHQGILTKIDNHKNNIEESLTILSRRAKHVALSAIEERRQYLGSYFANTSLGNVIAGPK